MKARTRPAAAYVWRNAGDLNATAPNGEVVAPGCTTVVEGATLLQMFAGHALQGLIASHPVTPSQAGHNLSAADLAKSAINAAMALCDALDARGLG